MAIQLMSLTLYDRVILLIKRADSPVTKALKAALRRLAEPKVLRMPRFLTAPLRGFYELHFLLIQAIQFVVTTLYRGPLFQSRCASFGKNLVLDGPMPLVSGHLQIHIGDNCYIGGHVFISSGRVFDEPNLIVGNGSSIGWNTQIVVNREVIIEDDVTIAFNCRIADSDGHPREADLRIAKMPPDPKDIRPVRICKKAWIGNGAHIMKAVTIGEGAIIGANSVVMSNIPPYCLALGNPAKVFFKNFGLPTDMKKDSVESEPADQAV
jgi:acetyltransferase-like isoleucine patch superfamily enzyme